MYYVSLCCIILCCIILLKFIHLHRNYKNIQLYEICCIKYTVIVIVHLNNNIFTQLEIKIFIFEKVILLIPLM